MRSLCRLGVVVVVIVVVAGMCVRFIAAFIFAGRKYLCVLAFDRYNRSTQQFALLYAAELQTFVTVCVFECVFCILFINIFYFSCMCAAATPLLLILLTLPA